MEVDARVAAATAAAPEADEGEGEYADWTRADLIAALRRKSSAFTPHPKVHKGDRPFDFTKHAVRKIALKVAYFGWPYAGLASQDSTEETIEGYLFKALLRAKLVQDRVSSLYTRCGRTDRGVSAFSQVVALTVRSVLPSGATTVEGEMDYGAIINRLLPANIRVVGWAPVDAAFNARFGCLQRTYKYFFDRGTRDIAARECASIPLQRMQEAASAFVGMHNYRNFCHADRGKGPGQNFVRHIYRFDIVPAGPATLDPSRQMYTAIVTGKAFLWHQIRCMMAVLFAVGEGLEAPSIVATMLDLAQVPLKPQYEMAPELPLVLVECGYEDVKFIGNPEEQSKLVAHVRGLWLERQFMTTLSDELLELVLGAYVPTSSVRFRSAATDAAGARPQYLRWAEAQRFEPVQPLSVRKRTWTPLLQRLVEPALTEPRRRPDDVGPVDAAGGDDE